MSLSDSTSQILGENLSLSEMLEIGVIGDPTYEEAIRNKISSLTHEELTVYFRNNPITEESFEKQRVLFQSPKIVFNFFEKIPADFRLSCFREAIQFLKSKETADKDEIACFGHAMDKLRAASDYTNYLNIAEFNGICKDFLVVLSRQDD